eukprot:g3473.t1
MVGAASVLNVLTFAFRMFAALYSPIVDCDETFNFWEPAHFMFYGYGMQTWEYAPAYALRSYSYLAPHGFVGFVVSETTKICVARGMCADSVEPKVIGFYAVRILLALISARCEISLARAIESRFDRSVGRFSQFFMAISPGMFIASPAFLPTSTAMCVVMIVLTLWIRDSHIWACAIAAFGGIACGWPFVGAIFVPVGLDTMFTCGLFCASLSVIGGASIALLISVGVDYVYYGHLVAPAAKIVLYNVIGAGGDDGSDVGAELYGTEPWTFFLKNGLLNFNIMFPLALASPLALMAAPSVPRLAKRRLLLMLSPLFLWLAIMQSRAHKEERFLYVVYPIICVAAASALRPLLQTIAHRACKCVLVKHRARVKFASLVAFSVLFGSFALSSSRIASQVMGFGAPLTLYRKLATHIRLLPDEQPITVCVGGEWYRYASSYFLPTNARLSFLKSSFGGQLPQPFLEPDDPSAGGFYTQTSTSREHFNNVNREEVSRYVETARCDYIVDLDLNASRDGWNRDGADAPWLVNEMDWDVLESIPFLDRETCGSAYRAFWVPRLTSNKCLVRGKSSQLEIKVSKEGKGAVFFGKIKTTNRSRYTVRPKRFVLTDNAAGASCQIQVQLVRSACEAILRKGRATSSDKFLVQIFKPAESAHEKLKDLPEEEVESFLERLCRKAEKEAGKDAGKAHIETPSGSLHFKYLRTRFKLGELSAPKEEIAMNRKLFDELIELRKLYEETVMESVEYMAREEQLRMKLEATRSEYAKLEKATRGDPSQQVSSGNASEAVSTAFRPHISV